jgi:hypothetical protein
MAAMDRRSIICNLCGFRNKQAITAATFTSIVTGIDLAITEQCPPADAAQTICVRFHNSRTDQRPR